MHPRTTTGPRVQIPTRPPHPPLVPFRQVAVPTLDAPRGDGDDGAGLHGLADLLAPVARDRTLPCRQLDAELWFAEMPADVEAAKAFCRECPIVEACLAGARERREPWGVWGGELFVQGEVVARKRPRGRPRKTEVAA